MEFWLRYDLRSPAFGTPTAQLIAAALEQVAWADKKGFHTVQLSEHHASGDGYNPSPLVLGGAIAAVTECMRINPPVVLPLYDPVKFAEDCCILDQISQGRLDLTIVMGYVPREFAMFGESKSRRARVMEEKLAVIKQVFNGEPFTYRGRQGKVTPLPFQPGGPRLYIGADVSVGARRAAKFGHGLFTMFASPEVIEAYENACREQGNEPGKVLKFSMPVFFYLSDDPDKAWAQVAPHAMHEANEYAKLAAEIGWESPFPAALTPDDLRATGSYQVMTPEDFIAHCRTEHAAGKGLIFSPMMGGLSPEIAWQSLELFVDKVLPTLKAEGLVDEP